MKTWNLDPTHSELQFKVKHLVISTVTGTFKSFNASATTDDDGFEGAKITFSADIDSIDTGVEQRDGHLKSADFFDAAAFPKLSFEGTHQGGKLSGQLTLKGVSKPVSLDVDFGGTSVDFYGNTKAGFEVTGKISRKEFGLTWDAVTEAGAIVVSDEVKLVANIQLQLAN